MNCTVLLKSVKKMFLLKKIRQSINIPQQQIQFEFIKGRLINHHLCRPLYDIPVVWCFIRWSRRWFTERIILHQRIRSEKGIRQQGVWSQQRIGKHAGLKLKFMNILKRFIAIKLKFMNILKQSIAVKLKLMNILSNLLL